MSTTSHAVRQEVAAAPAAEDGWFSPKRLLIYFAITTAVWLGYRYYQQDAAWTYGLDAMEPEFQTYWMNLMYAQLVFCAMLAACTWGYVWKTRDLDVYNVAPREEIKRTFRLIAFIVAYTYVVYISASYFAEQDGAWHAVTTRDTDFTPSHIPLFYLGVPAYIIAGVGAFLYARTRLPEFAKRISVPFVIGVAGPFLILPWIGVNEWAHSFWVMEEFFGSYIHWGFVILGWSALALGGLLLQILRRLTELVQEVTDEPAAS